MRAFAWRAVSVILICAAGLSGRADVTAEFGDYTAQELPADGVSTIEIGPEFRTVWYEVEAMK